MTSCGYCGKVCVSERGLKMHYGFCYNRNAKLNAAEEKKKMPEQAPQVINITHVHNTVVNDYSLHNYTQIVTYNILSKFRQDFELFESSCIPALLEIKKAGFTGEAARQQLIELAKTDPRVQIKRIAEALEKDSAVPIVHEFEEYATIDTIEDKVCNGLNWLNDRIDQQIGL